VVATGGYSPAAVAGRVSMVDYNLLGDVKDVGLNAINLKLSVEEHR
jgi:hypothetical protein